MRAGRGWRGCAAAGVLGVLVAGCGGGATPATQSTAATRASTPATTTVTTTTTTSTTPTVAPAPTVTGTTAPTPGAGSDRCQPDQLSLVPGAARAAAGHYAQTLVFTNTSSSTCTMYGYPGLQLVGADGQAVDVDVQRGAGYAVQDPGPKAISLGPKQSAYFMFGAADVSQPGGAPCPAATRARVIPPNDYTQLEVAVHVAACPHARVAVSAVAPGSGAGG